MLLAPSAAGLANSLQLQIESLQDRLHVAELAMRQSPSVPALVQASQEPPGQQHLYSSSAAGLLRLQQRVGNLCLENSKLKAAAARLSRALAEVIGRRSSSGRSLGTEVVTAVLAELTAAEELIAGLQI